MLLRLKNSLRRSLVIDTLLLIIIAAILLLTATPTTDVRLETSNSAPSKNLTPTSRLTLSLPHDFNLRDEIGQMLMIGVTSEASANDLETRYQIGGFLVRPDSDLFSKQATSLVRKAGKLPPLFAMDEEGGEIARLPSDNFTQDSAKYMGGLSDSDVKQIAFEMGSSMASLGIDVDFAPVVDLDNGHNAAISDLDRSFSSNPAVVAEKAQAFASGLRQAGIIPTFKHFPGLGNADGNTQGNTDTGSATSPDLASLRESDLLPYKKILQAGLTSTVMVGNQVVPGLSNGLPASLSKNTYALLRKDYGFNQVVFTDELILAKAVSDSFSPAAAVVTAIEAGADMPLIDTDDPQIVTDIIDAVESAVHNGQIKQSQIDASLNRILALKS